MTKDAALKMAIEFISKNKDAINGFNEIKEMNEAIQACKKALEQPTFDYNTAFSHGYEAHRVEQKLEQPAYETESWKNNMKEAEKILAKAKFANEQPSQEPVAWLQEYENENGDIYHTVTDERIGINDIPVYTHPAPSWQGLTAKEIASIPLNEYTVQTVERILKEKNNV